MRRKAVSPMIATVLLIFFAIALGAVIMNWGANYAQVEEGRNQKIEEARLKCDRFVKMEVASDGLLCVIEAQKELRATLVNSGKIGIDGVRMILVGKNNFETTFFDLDTLRLVSGDAKKISQVYDFQRLGMIQHLEIIPKIDVQIDGQLHACESQKIEFSDIPAC